MNTNRLTGLLQRLLRKEKQDPSHLPAPSTDAEMVKQIVRGIITTRPDEIGCDECFEQVNRFAEIVLDGKNVSEALPLVQDHLERCGDCRDEFEALLSALRALA